MIEEVGLEEIRETISPLEEEIKKMLDLASSYLAARVASA